MVCKHEIQCIAVVYKFRIRAEPEPIGMAIEWLHVCECYLQFIFNRYLHSRFSLHPKQQVLPVKNITSISLCTKNYRWNALPGDKRYNVSKQGLRGRKCEKVGRPP
jgi:hypothetical protein